MGHFESTAVIKVGSGAITSEAEGIRKREIDAVVGVCDELVENSIWPVVVASGAINAGRQLAPGIWAGNETIEEQQYLSAIGQPSLNQDIRLSLERKGLHSGQLLLEPYLFQDSDEIANAEDVANGIAEWEKMPVLGDSYARAAETFLRLIQAMKDGRTNLLNVLGVFKEYGVIPIINENDSTSVFELRFDNDYLGGEIAKLLGADFMAMITENAHGLHASDGSVIPMLPQNRKTYAESCVTGDKSKFGRGGMASKNEVGFDVAAHGIPTLIMGIKDLGLLASAIHGTVQKGPEEDLDPLGFGTLYLPYSVLGKGSPDRDRSIP